MRGLTGIWEEAIIEHERQIKMYKRWIKTRELNPGWDPHSGYWIEKRKRGEVIEPTP